MLYELSQGLLNCSMYWKTAKMIDQKVCCTKRTSAKKIFRIDQNTNFLQFFKSCFFYTPLLLNKSADRLKITLCDVDSGASVALAHLYCIQRKEKLLVFASYCLNITIII